jgi:hypothetical protein
MLSISVFQVLANAWCPIASIGFRERSPPYDFAPEDSQRPRVKWKELASWMNFVRWRFDSLTLSRLCSGEFDRISALLVLKTLAQSVFATTKCNRALTARELLYDCTRMFKRILENVTRLIQQVPRMVMMYKRTALILMFVALSMGFAASISQAQSDVIQIPTEAAPPGYVMIEEDRWFLMADEPGNHVGRAREAFVMMDARKAASELRKAALQIRMAASGAGETAKRNLIRSEHELQKAAQKIEEGTLASVDELDVITARALHTLSSYQYVKAEQAWQKKKVQQAGHYLRASADNIERAAAKTESRFRAATSEVARESRVLSGSLIEGTGYVVDEVGAGLERIGHQIERVGAKVMPQAVK